MPSWQGAAAMAASRCPSKQGPGPPPAPHSLPSANSQSHIFRRPPVAISSALPTLGICTCAPRSLSLSTQGVSVRAPGSWGRVRWRHPGEPWTCTLGGARMRRLLRAPWGGGLLMRPPRRPGSRLVLSHPRSSGIPSAGAFSFWLSCSPHTEGFTRVCILPVNHHCHGHPPRTQPSAPAQGAPGSAAQS